MTAPDNRETGARPVRTRHCEYGVWLSFPPLGKPGKADGHMKMYEPGDLPFMSTGRDSQGHESLAVLQERDRCAVSYSYIVTNDSPKYRVSFLLIYEGGCITMKNQKKIIIAAVCILAALIAVFAIVYFLNRPAAKAGQKDIKIEVTDSTGETTEYELITDAEFLKGAMDELTANGSGFTYSGTDSEYGIMVEVINGESAVYEKDGAYWALYVNDEYGQYGADSQPVTDGDDYLWKYELAQ